MKIFVVVTRSLRGSLKERADILSKIGWNAVDNRRGAFDAERSCRLLGRPLANIR